jgi:hypothetical protein
LWSTNAEIPRGPAAGSVAAKRRKLSATPPYAGAHTEIVPHLTVGQDARRSVLEHAAKAVSTHLPIRASVDAVRLIAGTPDQYPWRTRWDFPLET